MRGAKATFKATLGETMGRWGCSSCGTVVGNGHTGPCSRCNGPIGRLVPNTVRLDADLGVVMLRREVIPPVVVMPPRDWKSVALVAAAVSCVAAPMLGAANAGWSAFMVIMALNIWSSSISYYALAIVGRREPQAA